MTPHKNTLIEELKEIIWSIDAKFSDNHPSCDSDYYAAQLLSLIESTVLEVIGLDETGHAAAAGTTYKEGKTKRNALRAEQRQTLKEVIHG